MNDSIRIPAIHVGGGREFYEVGPDGWGRLNDQSIGRLLADAKRVFFRCGYAIETLVAEVRRHRNREAGVAVEPPPKPRDGWLCLRESTDAEKAEREQLNMLLADEVQATIKAFAERHGCWVNQHWPIRDAEELIFNREVHWTLGIGDHSLPDADEPAIVEKP